MHRLVYLCDWLPPDFGAVGQYSLLFARERAARGEEGVLAGLSSPADSGAEEAGGGGRAGLSSTADSVAEEAVGAGRLRIVRLRARTYDRADLRTRTLWTVRTDL